MGHNDTHRTLHQLFNANDLDAMDDYIREDVTSQDHPRGLGMKGRDEFKSWLREWKTALSDARVEDTTYYESGNTSIATFRARGTNDGEMNGMAATGKAVDMPFCEFLFFDSDGKVEASAAYYDVMTMLVQLGHAEPPG